MPLARRVPKRGFHNRWAEVVQAVNVGDLDQWYRDGDEVTPATLRARRQLKGRRGLLKVLGDGELTKKLRISAHRFSRTALAKIHAAGGAAVVLAGKAPVVKNKRKRKTNSKAR